jgi:hypothetical protein
MVQREKQNVRRSICGTGHAGNGLSLSRAYKKHSATHNPHLILRSSHGFHCPARRGAPLSGKTDFERQSENFAVRGFKGMQLKA